MAPCDVAAALKIGREWANVHLFPFFLFFFPLLLIFFTSQPKTNRWLSKLQSSIDTSDVEEPVIQWPSTPPRLSEADAGRPKVR